MPPWRASSPASAPTSAPVSDLTDRTDPTGPPHRTDPAVLDPLVLVDALRVADGRCYPCAGSGTAASADQSEGVSWISVHF